MGSSSVDQHRQGHFSRPAEHARRFAGRLGSDVATYRARAYVECGCEEGHEKNGPNCDDPRQGRQQRALRMVVRRGYRNKAADRQLIERKQI